MSLAPLAKETNMKIVKKIVGNFWLFFILTVPSVALAQFGKIPALQPLGWDTGTADLTLIVPSILNIIFGILGFLAVAYLIYGGVLYITAGGDAEKAGKGKVAITNAIIGIIIILLAVAIYNFLKTEIKPAD